MDVYYSKKRRTASLRLRRQALETLFYSTFLFTKSALNRLRAHRMLRAVEPTRDSVAVFTKVFLRLTLYVCT